MMCEVCNHEDNRGKMIIICPVCLTNNKLAERKQGALEELRKEKRLLKKIINLDLNDNENYVSPEICRLIEDELKRIKELEKEGVEQK